VRRVATAIVTSTGIVARGQVAIVARGRVAVTSTEIVDLDLPAVAVRIAAPGTKADVHSPA
jgi:hypothetical protein